jgi:hypothetical protein
MTRVAMCPEYDGMPYSLATPRHFLPALSVFLHQSSFSSYSSECCCLLCCVTCSILNCFFVPISYSHCSLTVAHCLYQYCRQRCGNTETCQAVVSAADMWRCRERMCCVVGTYLIWKDGVLESFLVCLYCGSRLIVQIGKTVMSKAEWVC